MKFKFFKPFFVLAIALSVMACKSDKNEAKDAAAVKEAAVTSVTYTIDSTSVLNWNATMPGRKFNGTVNTASGTFSTVDNKLDSGSVVMDMNTITVLSLEAGKGKEQLEGHLKGTKEGQEEHFFNVTAHPTAGFEITGLNEVEGKTILSGNLTIKGITKNIEFPISFEADGNALKMSSESFIINRTLWEINYMSKSVFGDLKDRFISDDLVMSFEISATKTE